MRRYVGWFFAAVLIAVPVTATAARLPAAPNVPRLLMLRLFGEVSDAQTPLTFAGWHAGFDSPLRQAAFVVRIDTASSCCEGRATPMRSVTIARLALPSRTAFAAAPAPPRVAAPAFVGASAESVTSSYEPAAPAFLSGGIGSDAFSFMRAPRPTVPAFVVQSALQSGGDAVPNLGSSVQLPVALRVGNLRLIAGFDAGLATTASGIDDTLPVFIPPYAAVNRSSLGAHIAVPIAPRLLVGLGYNTERLVTGYGMPSTLAGLDARNDTYSGNLTFLFPRLSSALSLSAQQYRYQDNLVPAEFTQLREDLNLTVKF